MIDSYFRAPYQRLFVEPVAMRLAISPHLITLLGALFGLLVLPLLAFGFSFWAAGSLLVSGYLDTLDGSIARRHGTSSQVGALYDILADRLVEGAAILGLFSVAPQSRALLSLLMLCSILLCVTSFLVVGIFTENSSHKGFFYSPGIMERAEAFLFFLAMILLPNLFSELATAFTGLVLLTALLRTVQFVQGSRLRRQPVEVRCRDRE